MRRALLIALLILPPTPWALAGGRAALTLDAPAHAASGLPFVARVCVDAPADVRVVLRAPSAPPAGRYAPWSAGCRDVTLEPDDVEGDLVVDARVRDAAPVAWTVTLARPDLPARALRIVAVYGAPFDGALVENTDAARSADLRGLTLAGVRLGNATLAPGERIFIGASAPPDAERYLRAALAWSDKVTLALSRLQIDTFTVPKLAAGELVDREATGAHRAGLTRVAAAPMRVEGALVAYATPDAGAAPVVELLDGAQRDVLVEAYTLTSLEVAAALARALDRGANVSLLVEGAPVGGVPPEERGVLATLEARGARVRMLQGDAASFPTRYRTLHAKTIVVDGSAVLVATENLRASSYPAEGGDGVAGTRGYGVIVHNASLAAVYASVFAADGAPWPDVRALDEGAAGLVDLAARPLVAGRRFEAEGSWNVTPVLSPESSWAQLALINASHERIDAEQLFADARAPFLDALVAAARRGVAVRVLLDGREDAARNAAAAQMLGALAAREGLPLVVRVDSAPRTLHAKLVLVDGHAAFVGSMNWGLASATSNREAGLIVDSVALASWYETWFEKDWSANVTAVPGGGAAAGARGRATPAASLWVSVVVLALTARAASRASRSKGRT